jgi:hypothetical protein
MHACNPQLIKDELQSLVRSERKEEREAAVAHVVRLLTSADAEVRRQGYALFREGIAETLFCSCLNYGSLAGGFTEPLIDIVTRTVEFWAAGSAGRTPDPRP